ncbi:MAG: hypothetical protein V3T22_09275, partial [Planctomycetota bacterium]
PAAGDLRFGFFVIEPDGRPRRVHERVGTGPGGVDDPFVGRVAVDPAGQGLLVATTLAAGGDLIEVNLARGKATLRTAQLPPLVFSDAGLWLAPDWGFGVAHDGVYRFLRTPLDSADAVDFPGVPPGWFSGEAVCSPLYTFAATTAGARPTSQHVWVIGRDGPARRATRFPGTFSGAGFLPESPHGPYLAVSDDGALCAWRSEGLTREAWMAPVKASPVPATQPTADAFFLDTLDEVGQMNFRFSPVRLTVAVGGRDAADGALEKMDLFDVSLDANGLPLFTNRTLSSGDAVVPFLSPGTIAPEVAHWMPGTKALLILDEKGDRLLGLPAGQVGVTVLLNNAKELQVVEVAGSALLVGLRRSSGSKPGELFRTSTALDTPATQLPGGGDDTEFFHAVGDGIDTVALLAIVADTNEFVLRVDLGTGVTEIWQAAASEYVTPLGFTRTGATAFAQGPSAGPVALRVWPRNRPAQNLQAPPGPGLVLH